MKNIVITGVSAGIGYATTAELLHRGYRVFGSVRKEADAERLQDEFGSAFTPLLFDVTDHGAISRAVQQVSVAVHDKGLDALINNAGILVPGPLMLMPLSDFRAQFDVNLFGLLDVSQQFLPLLGACQDPPFAPGRIVNVGSVSGKIAYPFMGAYAASKHALEALSDALRRELMLYGVDVVLIESGTTRTPIVDKVKRQLQKYRNTAFAGMIDAWLPHLRERETSGLPMETVVAAICQAVQSERPKTRYVIPRKRLIGWLIPRWLPDRWLDRFTANRLGI